MLEFLILIGIGMLLVAITTSVVITVSGDASQDRHDRSVLEQYERVRSELLAATIAVDGYTTTLSFDPPYRGVSMNLTIENASLAVRSPKAVSGGMIPGVIGDLHTSGSTITIEKRDSEVHVS